jgi:endonuclease-3 related protein
MKTRKQVDSEKTDRAAPRPPLRAIYRRLFKAFGPQHWWPAESDLEMMVGAILTQNTAWTNVEKAIRRLKEHQALDLGRLHRADLRQLADWIRPAGYFNIKARRLRALTLFLYDRFGGDIGRLFQLETGELRRALLEVKGIGPETADR